MTPLIGETDQILLLTLLPPEHPLALALCARAACADAASRLAQAIGKEEWSRAHELLRALETQVAPFSDYYGHEVVYYSSLLLTMVEDP